MRSHRKETLALWGFVLVWLSLNLLLLTRYPLVHSDESWLGGLTRNMLAQGSPGVTEPFFDLKPRYPHAIKILFHLLQMPFIGLFGYNVFALRLLSLLAGGAALALCYRCCRVVAPVWLSFAITAAVSVNAQFLSAAHTARQEILLLAFGFWLALRLLRAKGAFSRAEAVRLGLITGLSVGLHPNSFLLAMGCGLAMLLSMVANRRLSLRPLLTYIAVTAAVAMVFVGLSFLMDGQFPAHYRRYGESEFDLGIPVTDKLAGFGDYLRKLWLSQSGTYVLPDLRAQLALTGLLLVWAVFRLLRARDAATASLLGLTLGAMLGTAVIGRYNQLSASLWMLPCLLLLAPLLAVWKRPYPSATLVTVIGAAFFLATVPAVAATLPYDYARYGQALTRLVQPSQKTLGNLNTAFFFDNDALLDVRNLAYLRDNGLTFAEYVHSRGIRVILWSDEMAFIYSRRPDYNALYGNPRTVPEVEAFLRERCTLLGTVEDSGYAGRIVSEIGKPHSVAVYQVNMPTGE